MEEMKKEHTEKTLIISQDTKNTFQKILKQGIYKELYQRTLLSDEQLNALTKNK